MKGNISTSPSNGLRAKNLAQKRLRHVNQSFTCRRFISDFLRYFFFRVAAGRLVVFFFLGPAFGGAGFSLPPISERASAALNG